ncbi:MAG: prepilin peptidase [Acidaminococcaceae bacterium]|nr:prepilin peptidase [Acidaminococcaceae bacterium]
MSQGMLHLIAIVFLCAEGFALWRFQLRWQEKQKPAAAPADGRTAQDAVLAAAEADGPKPEASAPSGGAAGMRAPAESAQTLCSVLFPVLSLGVYFYAALVKDYAFLYALMEAAVFAWLAVVGWIDAWYRVIPNALILAGLGFWAVLVLLEIVVGGTPARQVLVYALLGGGITFVVLFVMALVMKSGLGMGDVKLFSVLGLCYGLAGVYSLLVAALLAMAAVALVLWIGKRVTLKSSLPMAPFAMVGFLVNLFFGLN